MHLEQLCTCFTSIAGCTYYTMMYVPMLNNIILFLEQSKQYTGVATNAEQCNLLLTVATPLCHNRVLSKSQVYLANYVQKLFKCHFQC